MSKSKKISSPFSTGSGGGHFEAHVQASFVALMLAGGYAPCLPCWPIKEIKLQGKIDGFDTDDLIVVVENPHSKERRKLLGQVKHSISITQGSHLFGEVMQAAWNDFNNSHSFTKEKDIIALITGPLSATDAHNVQWLLSEARHTKNRDGFFLRVGKTNFSPSQSNAKLQVIQHHLEIANGGKDVLRDELYSFLNHLYLLDYDLGYEYGVVLSLLHSHISQFQQQYPQWVWSRIVDIVQTWNQNAGTITSDKLPEDLLDVFKQKTVIEMPDKFKAIQTKSKTDWARHPDATYLAFAVLIGAWNEKSKSDSEVIPQLMGIEYDTWLQKAREILHCQDSPLSLKNGIWKVVNPSELWILLGSRILDQNLDRFRSLALTILKEPDPAFELPSEDRYAASIYGKVLNHSQILRAGIAEGLALLGSHPKACSNCSQGKVEAICLLVIREPFSDADWVLWGSLSNLLPTLAEAAPDEFFNAVEKALSSTPCPFDELFAQEGKGIFSSNYLTGLFWALEGLAWDEQYLVRACVVLGELASHDPGGHWANRPSNSLVTILLPWLPQTLAPFDKRKAAVQTLLHESPDIAWDLIIQLLPGGHQVSSGSHKPIWRMLIPDNRVVTNKEYWQQVEQYSEIAVNVAKKNANKLTALIERMENLPKPVHEKLLEYLKSDEIIGLPQTDRLVIWTKLADLVAKHRRFPDAKWAMNTEQIENIAAIADRLAPETPSLRHQRLFEDSDFLLYEGSGDYVEQQNELEGRRQKAVAEIAAIGGVRSVLEFATVVHSPIRVGMAFGIVAGSELDREVVPVHLASENKQLGEFVFGFILGKFRAEGWPWVDSIVTSQWTPGQIGQFLALLPFTSDTWKRARALLGSDESAYWLKVDPNPYVIGESASFAVEQLIHYGRPFVAIRCLNASIFQKQEIDSGLAIQALLGGLSSLEKPESMDSYQISEVIKYLQDEPDTDPDDLFHVEWAYLPLLDRDNGASPKLLERRLADDPSFFCEVVRSVFPSNHEEHIVEEPSENTKRIAANAYRLLTEWRIPPGLKPDGSFEGEAFAAWTEAVKRECSSTGHLEVAMTMVGHVLIYAPADPDGLWINRAIAEVLNAKDHGDMREGFKMKIFDSRGVHFVDPTGKPERELADKYYAQADAAENAGYSRLATTLRELAASYKHEAEHWAAGEHLDA
ncbi:MAG TPA: hypothetical protein VMX35_13460 [Acidobacteriota bacterium]|nr:hypothetical protein [Acidobacteriota bacterium]